MSVYVDDMYMPANVPNGNRTVRGVWSHMQADTREELDDMADKIGLKRSWIQYPDKPWRRHYDVTKSKRALAVKAGAIEMGMLELSRLRIKWRAEGDNSNDATTPSPHPGADGGNLEGSVRAD